MLPHDIFFILFNLIYILPVAYIYFYGFEGGGVTNSINLTSSVVEQMMFFYIVMFVSFLVGSLFTARFFKLGTSRKIFTNNCIRYKLTLLQYILICIIALACVFFKFMLYKDGVYDSYAYDSGAMSSKYWTVSMGLSEICIAMFIFFLITEHKYLSWLSFLLVCLNLLHGTRIFTTICCIILAMYCVYYKRYITGIKLLIVGLLSFVIVLTLFFVVFIVRSKVDISLSDIDLDMIISPVVYESVFNQISFIKMIDFMNIGKTYFAPHQLFSDVILFTIPQFTSVAKTALMHSSDFGALNPLGGLSGYASAIIYFSKFYFIWYLILGSFSSFLLRLSESSKMQILTKFIYIYFICDTMFRFQRDPFFIAGKMLIDNILFVFVFLILRTLISKSNVYVRGSYDYKSR